MKFAKIVFAMAGLYGLVTLLPSYFLEPLIAARNPPAITHPEFFYGFLGVALAWQFAFFAIALDPRRYRPLMTVAFVEKLGFGAATIVLFVMQRVQPQVLGLGLVDLTFGALFLMAHARTRETQTRKTGTGTGTAAASVQAP